LVTKALKPLVPAELLTFWKAAAVTGKLPEKVMPEI